MAPRALAILGILACLVAVPAVAEVPTSVGMRGEVTDQFGASHALEGLGQGLVVVDFAASWCEPCYTALPRLEALAQQHPGVRFVIVSVDESTEGRDRIARDLGLELPVLWDEAHRIVEAFSPDRFPATYVLDDGQVIHHQLGSGEVGWRELLAFVDGLEPVQAAQR